MNIWIAVKKVSEGSKQGRKEYESEVKIISQMRHKNLVELMGWCHRSAELLLVNEFMPNGSLDYHLFKNESSVLTFEKRYRIAEGVASAILYLHEVQSRKYVVHRDVKVSNVMLDHNFNAKLGDFGLARLVDHDKDLHSTVPAGTIGYIAPEYSATGKASKETDIFSFGIVLLETACGRKPVDHRLPGEKVLLMEWVWGLYESGKVLDAADPRLCFSRLEVQKIERLMVVGLWCVHPRSGRRPTIRQVVRALTSEDPLPSLPLAMPKAVYDDNAASASASALPSQVATTNSSSHVVIRGSSSLTISSGGFASDLLPS
ncbi:hypothetical protein SASPL_123622 [Salvia splendens]|uniref:Protein kinase domain-containing protein n=2 Tax=Salvia splendens TaxID=180675 RepID=A0A8X8XM03_SALSN|nr:hypothetical protein SASPL_123622 [Salvia splendens]